MITIYVEGDAPIKLGHVRDNEAYRVAFPIRQTLELYGAGGVWNILYKRPTEPVAYPVPPNRIYSDVNFLYWVITATEVQFPGKGECQLSYMIGDVTKMSYKWQTGVCSSLISGGNAPSYIESWLEQLTDIKDTAVEASATAVESASAVMSMDVEARTLPSTASATVEKVVDPTGAVTLKFGLPRGADGGMSVVVVPTLPESGADNTIYMIPSADPSSGNLYDEYIWANGAWERVGGMSVNLDNYLTKDDAKNTYVPLSGDNTSVNMSGELHFNSGSDMSFGSAGSITMGAPFGGLSFNSDSLQKNGVDIATVDDIPDVSEFVDAEFVNNAISTAVFGEMEATV